MLSSSFAAFLFSQQRAAFLFVLPPIEALSRLSNLWRKFLQEPRIAIGVAKFCILYCNEMSISIAEFVMLWCNVVECPMHLSNGVPMRFLVSWKCFSCPG